MTVRKAIIIGAGLAGLTTAYRLKKSGWQVKLFESTHQVGGRAVSVSKQGYLFDSGAVGLGTVYKDYMELVGELGLQDKVVKSSTVSAIVRDAKLHEIDSAKPMTALTSKLWSFRSKLKLINLARDLSKVKPHLDIRDVAAASQFDDETIEAYSRRRLNGELLEYLIEPLARTVNLTRAKNVSKLEVMNSLAGLFATTLITLRGGVAVFAQRLAEGLDIRLNTLAQRVERFSDHVEITSVEAAGSRSPAGLKAAVGMTAPVETAPVETAPVVTMESADVCVIATTLPHALALYPQARTDYAPLADVIRYNRGLCVHLGYQAATATKALIAMMPPCEHEEIALFFFEHNKGPDRASANHSMITVFFDDTAVDRPWNLDDETLIKETAAQVEKIMPELAGKLEMSHVTRWPLGLTNPGLGIYKAMHKVNDSVDPADRVQLVGDYRSTAGQNSAVAWGNNVAGNLIKHFAA